MALAYIMLGTFAGLLCAVALAVSGFGVFTSLAAFSVIGTTTSLVGIIAKAGCPSWSCTNTRACWCPRTMDRALPRPWGACFVMPAYAGV